MNRRRFLTTSLLGAGTVLAGCTASTTSEPENSTQSPTESTPQASDEASSCDEYVYRGGEQEADGRLPWDLQIRNIPPSHVPVSISITDLSKDSPKKVVSCTATSDEHTELVFDLTPGTEYRVHVTLERSNRPAEDSTTVTWGLEANEALEVRVEEEFTIRRIHYDPAFTPEESRGSVA